MTVQLLIVCITVLLLAGLVVSRRSSAPAVPGEAALTTEGRETVLQIGDGQSVRGIVVAEGAGVVTLQEAVLTFEGKDVKMGGVVRVPVKVVVMVQELPGRIPTSAGAASSEASG